MKKLNGKIKHNIAVFISGRGSNLKSIINYSSKRRTLYRVKVVISNKQKAAGLLIAKKKAIKSYYIDLTKSKKLGNKVLNILNKNNIELVCLAGYMKILPKYFIKLYKGKIINIHPSLLPKYKGLNTHKRVIENNEKFSGCTVHYVNYKLDSGKIILQKKVRINKKENYKTLEKKILKQEHILYPKALMKIFSL